MEDAAVTPVQLVGGAVTRAAGAASPSDRCRLRAGGGGRVRRGADAERGRDRQRRHGDDLPLLLLQGPPPRRGDDGVDRPAPRPGGAVAAAGRHRGRPDGRRAAARVPGHGAPAEAVRGPRPGPVVGRRRRPRERRRGVGATSRRWATTSSRGCPAEVRADILAVLGHVWYSTLVSWANGRRDFSSVMVELERASRVLIEPHQDALRAARKDGKRP